MKKMWMTLALLATGAMATPALAADCAITIEGNDQMQFNIKKVEVPKSCAKYTMKAGAGAEYVKPNDPRVIGFSTVIGGGESTTFGFDVAQLKAGTEYTYFCSFPGHSFIMRGTLQLGS